MSPARVHVVVADDTRGALAATATVLGLERVPEAVEGSDPARLTPVATDLLRRLNRVFKVRADEGVGAGLVRPGPCADSG